MRKIALLSMIIILILIGFILLNSISIPAPTNVKEYYFSIDKYL